jgi:deazaflavin-dependent oxidoreductase (nitroreductase family)
VSEFPPAVLRAASSDQEIGLTTFGRRTGQPHRVTIWISTDGSRLFVRSGRGLNRDWPRNLLARGQGILHLRSLEVPVEARHVTDGAVARSVTDLVAAKYRSAVQRSPDDGSLSPAEQATFELLPVAASP